MLSRGRYIVKYFSFTDTTSLLYVSLDKISSALNHCIDNKSLLYVSGEIDGSINGDNTILTVLSKDRHPEIQDDLNICLKYGIITLDDPLPDRKQKYNITETGGLAYSF